MDMEKHEQNVTETAADWELSEDFYQQGEQQEIRLEDFMDDDSTDLNKDSGLNPAAEVSASIQQMAELVRQVQGLSGQGKTAADIAQALNMELQQVQDILICTQAFPEDNPLAVARLILLG